MKKDMTYSEALAELEEIVQELEQDDVEIDVLLDKVQRSSELLAFCQDKLTKTEAEVHSVISELPGDTDSEKKSTNAESQDEKTDDAGDEEENMQENDPPF